MNLTSSYPFQWAVNELSFKERGANLSFLNKISSLELETYLQNVLLRDADQMGMANSLEIRVPFLDHRLVEYVLSLSNQLKYPEYPKKLLVDSVSGWIPNEIIHRKKMGFVFPWEKWMKNELKDFCCESIKNLENLNILNFKNIELLWDNFLAGNTQVHWQQIWNLVVIGKWTSINLNNNR
jgi:asparagine synthase (glutamine-hydrolysing)